MAQNKAALAVGGKVASWKDAPDGESLVLLLFPFQAGGWELVIRESDGIEIFNLLALLAACYIIN